MLIAPSVLTADFSKLKQEIESIDNADYIHLDIMDGNFVPNLSFGPHIAKTISNETEVPLDTHLMVLDPLKWINTFTIPGTEFITVHYESENFLEAIRLIKEKGIKAGLSIKPATEVEEIIEYLPFVDLVLVMSVEPGFGGQKFMPEAIGKISDLNRIRVEQGLNYLIEVDGGINDETIQQVRAVGADIAVVGSYLFNQKNRKKEIKELKEL
ncbi:MAG TPA: ribulose-phosphate 3-epimerase [Acholeplasmataceae bacterium]|jgi:ribulose-phosphate 3-epimerase|nr:ribulose-phosphate 3-epimerase [Acholeplasmataceae bacterium]HPX71744.1 ribulose-phosphate 3-epimerase [Acholeplasmataceae bacterium]HQC30504.1 ribulose-phosphate 3-epimerase [Acholeplasmataceae bacterium]